MTDSTRLWDRASAPKLDMTHHPAPRPQNPASAVHRLGAKNPKCEKLAPPSIHHHQPTWLLAISGAAHPPRAQVHHAHWSLGKLADARSCRAKKLLQQRPRACCLDLAISPPMPMALCFCLASADHICLVRHRTIITDFASVLLAELPMSCAVPPVLLDRCAVFLRLFWRRHAPIASLCH